MRMNIIKKVQYAEEAISLNPYDTVKLKAFADELRAPLNTDPKVVELLRTSPNPMVSSFCTHWIDRRGGDYPWFDYNTGMFTRGMHLVELNAAHRTSNIATREEWRVNRVINKETGLQSNMLFGMEWEVYINKNHQTVNNTMSELFSLLPTGTICHKYDGSIRAEGDASGVEFNFTPLPLVRLKQIFNTLYNNREVDTKPLMNRIKANASCGIHIHMSREVVGMNLWHKYMHFVHTNRDILHSLVGRKETRYSTPSSTCNKPINTIRKEYIKNLVRASQDENIEPSVFELERSHTSSVNVTQKGTLETRIFPSTVDKDKIFAFLELTDAMFNYCINSSLRELTYQHFILWLLDYDQNRYLNKDRKATYISVSPQYKELAEMVMNHKESKVFLPQGCTTPTSKLTKKRNV